MKPDPRFRDKSKVFWAYVRSISEQVGYTERGTGRIKVPSLTEISDSLRALNLKPAKVINSGGRPTALGRALCGYFQLRAKVLNTEVEPALMDARTAAGIYQKLRRQLKTRLPVTMNKQKGKKKKPAYLTGIVSMLIEAGRGTWPCDHNPRGLTSFTKDGMPIRTLSRRIDGAFPAVINPVAVWEIKEYYHTTTFGSRVADGVYETQLDGLELEDLRKNEEVAVRHYLFLDAHYTWWECGRSYLCRIFDMVQMGLVDEVIVGRQSLVRIPKLVKEWAQLARDRSKTTNEGSPY